MSMFGHLRSVRKGDRDWSVPVTLHEYTPRKQRAFVPDGRYTAKIVDADGGPSYKNNGVVLRLMHRIELPVAFAGTEIEDWVYLTFDDTADRKAETDAGYNMNALQGLLYSVASAVPGMLEKLSALGPDGRPVRAAVGPALLLNKTVYFQTERGDANAVMRDGKVKDLSGTSRVYFYCGREEFEKQPGPLPVGSASAAEQTEAPEIGRRAASAGGNGSQVSVTGGVTAGRPGPAKVDDLVDF